MKAQLNNTLLIQALYLSLSGITAYQKISGGAVPEWFTKKFEQSFFQLIPFGIPAAFVLITALEALLALVFVLSIAKQEYKESSGKPLLSFGLDLSLLLFLILFFGSFLVSDYNNGALDFMYFGFTYYLKNNILGNKTQAK